MKLQQVESINMIASSQRLTQPQAARPLPFFAVILTHVVAVGVIINVAKEDRGITDNKLFLAAIALLMGDCSLCGIWWARVSWPLTLKTPLACLIWLGIWAGMMSVLDDSRQDPQRAAAWTTALAAQFVLAGAMAGIIEFAVRARRTLSHHRFTLLSLFIWTTFVACLLAQCRWLAVRYGWNTQSFFSWSFFPHIVAATIGNTALAITVLVCVRLFRGFLERCVACLFALGIVVPASVALMWVIFRDNLGVSVRELAGLFACEALFVMATLLPLQTALTSSDSTAPHHQP